MNNSTKTCVHCKSEINAAAKKCPHCQSDLRSVWQKHPISITLFLVVAIPFFIVFGSVLSDPTSSLSSRSSAPIQDSVITSLEEDFSSLAQGRWDDVQVGKTNSNELLVRVYAMSGANAVAIDGYCKLMKETVQKYLSSEYDLNLYVYQGGEVVKACL